jgi:AcrR family transcriptional regulator
MPKIVDAEERRAELTAAAARLIARSGIGAATMLDVAAEAGVTTGTLTHYFADKRELLLRTFEASLDGRRSQRPTRDPNDALTALRDTLAGALPIDDDRRRHWMVTVAFCAQAAGDVELGATQRDAYREFRAHVAALVAQIVPGTREAIVLAERLIAQVDGVAMQALFDPESWSAERQLVALERALKTVAAH